MPAGRIVDVRSHSGLVTPGTRRSDEWTGSVGEPGAYTLASNLGREAPLEGLRPPPPRARRELADAAGALSKSVWAGDDFRPRSGASPWSLCPVFQGGLGWARLPHLQG